MKGPEVVPVEFKLTPELLREHAGYATAMLGKWNLGHTLFPYTPTRRGFDTFFGYYAACLVDYWYHGSPKNQCGTNGPGDLVTDLSNSSGQTVSPADIVALNGTYTQEMLTAEAERLIHLHGARAKVQARAKARGVGGAVGPAGAALGLQPLYMYLAHFNTHGAVQTDVNLTLQAPAETVALYNRTALDTYKVAGAMLTELDEGVGRVVRALKEAGLYDNSVVTFACDNGGA
jgi:arylsulfatase B